MNDEHAVCTQDRSPRSAGVRDGGFNFVEVLLTIGLMGVVMVPVLTAVRASIQVSQVNENAAEVETLLINAADRVNRAPQPECDFTGVVQAAVQTAGWPASAATVVQRHLDTTASPPWQDGACPDGVAQTGIVQRVHITITSPDGSLSRSLEVVKGDV